MPQRIDIITASDTIALADNETGDEMNALDRSIALNLRINDSIRVRAWGTFSAACDACLMAELTRMTPAERREHAGWFSTDPVVQGASA